MSLSLVLALSVVSALPSFPSAGADVQAFVPQGWLLEARLEGDLDGDAFPDAVLVLVQSEATKDDRARALVVLQGQARGYKLLGANGSLLATFGGAGVRGGDGAPTLSLTKRVLVVTQNGGSREFYGSTHRFRLQKKEGFVLIGLDQSTGDSLNGATSSTSENFFTGDYETVEQGPQFDEDGKATPSPAKKTRSKKPVRPFTRFEDVVGNN
jgi:hypothetical protein